MFGQEAAEGMMTGPKRMPDIILDGPHEAAPPFDTDWTKVPGSMHDAKLWKQEMRLRDARNKMIREQLEAGRTVFYKSSGHSMWPLAQSNDAIILTPSRL